MEQVTTKFVRKTSDSMKSSYTVVKPTPDLVLKCVAVCCSVLQCVAVCCTVLRKSSYGVALASRIDKIICLFCKRDL